MKKLLELLDKADEMAGKLPETEHKEKFVYHIKSACGNLRMDLERMHDDGLLDEDYNPIKK